MTALRSRPGFHTSEFYVTVLTIIGSALTSIQGSLSPRLAAYFSIGATVAFTISRGLAKTEHYMKNEPPA